jgi:hypothetical protein
LSDKIRKCRHHAARVGSVQVDTCCSYGSPFCSLCIHVSAAASTHLHRPIWTTCNSDISAVTSRTSPHLAWPHLTSPHLASPHLTSPHLASPRLTSPHLTSSHLTTASHFHVKIFRKKNSLKCIYASFCSKIPPSCCVVCITLCLCVCVCDCAAGLAP